MPNLWQVLPYSLPWATVMLERSKGVDLVVRSYLPRPSPDHPKVLFLKEVLTKHASRIRELDLHGFEGSPLFEHLLPSSLRLHSLDLTCGLRKGYRAFPTGVMKTGNLRRLAVTGIDGPWYSLSLPAITNLKLHRISNRPPLVKFLEILRGFAALEVLDMDNSLPLAQNSVGAIEPIELPHLNYLRLSSSDYKEVTNILPVIIVPPTATLKFAVSNRWLVSTQQNYDELASSFSTFFCHLGQDMDLSYGNLHLEGGRRLLLKAWKDDGSKSMIPDLELRLELRESLHTFAQDMLRSIFPSLPLLNITTLTLDIFPVRALLEDTFGQLSRLQNVTVFPDCTTEFIQALKHKPNNYNTEDSVLFPALQSLWIHCCSSTRISTDLRNCLKERYERRAVLLKLRLIDCDALRDQDVESLREIVNDVEYTWGSERDDSEEDS